MAKLKDGKYFVAGSRVRIHDHITIEGEGEDAVEVKGKVMFVDFECWPSENIKREGESGRRMATKT